MFGWTASEIPLLICLPVLLVGSGFFSGSETALFGLTHTERMTLHSRGGVAGRALDALLEHPRMLLITVLLGNMVVNVLYFVISSVLLIKAVDANVAAKLGIGAGTLLIIIIVGEVIPKLVANSKRTIAAPLVAPPMLAIHRLITPLRRVLDALVVSPLSRLTAPTSAPAALEASEFEELLEVSSVEGVIDPAEMRVLKDVIDLRNRKVSDVMTPRVRIVGVPVDASRDDVLDVVRQTRLTKLPVYDGDIDRVVGILHVKRFLLDDRAVNVRGGAHMTRARFIPEMATLDRLLDDFRRTRTQVAIAVDEYGGTAGIIAIEDIVREIVGELRDARTIQSGSVKRLDRHKWRVKGDVDIRDLATVIGRELPDVEPASVSGLIARELGRAPEPGDVVQVGSLRLEVEAAEGPRVETAIATVPRSRPTLGGSR